MIHQVAVQVAVRAVMMINIDENPAKNEAKVGTRRNLIKAEVKVGKENVQKIVIIIIIVTKNVQKIEIEIDIDIIVIQMMIMINERKNIITIITITIMIVVEVDQKNDMIIVIKSKPVTRFFIDFILKTNRKTFEINRIGKKKRRIGFIRFYFVVGMKAEVDRKVMSRQLRISIECSNGNDWRTRKKK